MKINWKNKIKTEVLIISGLFLLFPVLVNAATLYVNASAVPPNYTTLATAITAANSGDAIYLQKNITENISNPRDITLTIMSDPGLGTQFSWSSTGAGDTLKFGAERANLLTIRNIYMTHTSGNTGYTIDSTINKQINLVVIGCKLDNPGTENAVVNMTFGSWVIVSGMMKMYQSTIIGGAAQSGINIFNFAGGDTVYLENTVVRDCGVAALSFSKGGGTNYPGILASLTNCTLYNNAVGLNVLVDDNRAGGTNPVIKNTLFLSNTDDYKSVTTQYYTYFTNCAFGEQTSQVGMTACQFSATTAEVLDAFNKDLHLAVGSTKCKDLGTNTGAPAADLDGVPRPYNIITDIGAYEYYIPPTATPTYTVTQTSTSTITPTNTPYYSPTITPTGVQNVAKSVYGYTNWVGYVMITDTNTPTTTPTSTVTNTPTVTQTITDTSTATNTPTNTPTATPTSSMTNTQTVTQTSTATNTPTMTQTATPTFTQTSTATITETTSPTVTETVTQTNTPTSTPTSTATITETTSPTVTNTVTQTNTPTSTPTATETITETTSPTVTNTVTQTNTPTSTPTITNTVTTTNTLTNTPTVTETTSATVTETITQTNTPTSTATSTPTVTETTSATVTETMTQTNTPTSTPTSTPTITETTSATVTETVTQTNTATNTPVSTPSITETTSATVTNTLTQTNTPTDTPSVTQTITDTTTLTNTETVTSTATETVTFTATKTITETVTFTNTPTVTLTYTNTATPSATETNTDTMTATSTYTNTPTATQTGTSTTTPTLTLTYTNTPTPSETATYTMTPTISPTPTITNTPVPYPYVLKIQVFNEAGELVGLIVKTYVSKEVGDVALIFQGKETTVYNPTQGNLVIDIPGLEAPGQEGGAGIKFEWNGTNNNAQAVGQGIFYISISTQNTYGDVKVITKEITILKNDEYTKIKIYNSAGEVVREIKNEIVNTTEISLASTNDVAVIGDNKPQLVINYAVGESVTWDGKNTEGRLVSSGVYEIEVTVKTKDGFIIKVSKSVSVLNQGAAGTIGDIKIMPNPFKFSSENGKDTTAIIWSGRADGDMLVKIYGLSGENIREFRVRIAEGEVVWNMKTEAGSRIVSGIYVCVLEAKKDSGEMEFQTAKMAVLQ